MKLNRTLSLCLTLVICAGLAIGGTLAYYTDQEKVTNTFKLSDGVDIILDEAVVVKPEGSDEWETTPERTEEGNTYKGIYPGAVLPKDPTITVAEGSDDTYVRVKVEVKGGMNWLTVYMDGITDYDAAFYSLINNSLGEGWKLTDSKIVFEPDRSVVYTLTYTERLSAGDETTPAFTEIVFSPKFDAELIERFIDTDKSFNVDVIGEAIQAATFNSATEAFANYDGTAWTVDTSWYTGTEKTYTLNTAGELAGLAQLVNAGTHFNGITLKLGDDIDLQNIEWTPIGVAANNTGAFRGIFDGQGHTISNLVVNKNHGAGLFGYVFTSGGEHPVITNVNVDKATITTNHYAGVIAAHSFGSILNCKVSNAVLNCNTEIINGIEDNGDKSGAIVGFTAPVSEAPSMQVTGNTAENVTINGARDAGQIAGIAAASIVHDNTIINVTVVDNGQLTGENVRNEEIGRLR